MYKEFIEKLPGCVKFSVNPSQCPSHMNCPIYKAGLCSKFGNILSKIYNELNRKGLVCSEIDDLVEDIVEAVLKSLNRLEDESNFAAWVLGIYRNKWNDFLRKKYEKPRIFSDLERDGDEMEDPSINGRRCERIENHGTMEETERGIEISHILQQLSLEDEKCYEIVFAWYEGMRRGKTNKQVAEGLDMIPNTFNIKLYRCLDKLRRMIGV